MKNILKGLMIMCIICNIANAQVTFQNVRIGGTSTTGTSFSKELPNVICTEAITKDDNVIVERNWATLSDETQPTFDYGTQFVAISNDGNFMVTANSDGPYHFQSYKWDGDKYVETAAPDTATTGIGYGAAISADGAFVCISEDTSPYIQTYAWNSGNNRYEATAAPDTLPANYSLACAMSNDGSKLTVTSGATPHFVSYDWSVGNNRYEATNSPDSDLAAEARNVAMSSDGTYMALTSISLVDAYLKTYKWDVGNARYEAMSAPDVAPAVANTIGQLAMSSDGTHIVIGQSTGFLSYSLDVGNNQYDKDVFPDTDVDGECKVALNADGLTAIIVAGSGGSVTPTFFKWNAVVGKYSLAPYPDSLISTGNYSGGVAIDGNTTKAVVISQSTTTNGQPNTFIIPADYTDKASIMTSPNAIPNFESRFKWALIGVAMTNGATDASISVGAVSWFSQNVDDDLVTP